MRRTWKHAVRGHSVLLGQWFRFGLAGIDNADRRDGAFGGSPQLHLFVTVAVVGFCTAGGSTRPEEFHCSKV